MSTLDRVSPDRSTISIIAPDGIGEIGPQTDLAGVVHSALVARLAASPDGPLRDGDIVVVTSKILSKHEGRFAPATERPAAIEAETVRTVARRKSMAIVETPSGLTQTAAGIDNSNVAAGTILLLPQDSDASAERLRSRLADLSGARIGVIVSDTAGRAWRIGQTDHAIGAAGVRVIDAYDGRTDAYGNELHVTAVAIADELAAAADLVKRKLAGRPVAVIRGLGEFVTDPGSGPGLDSGGDSGARPTARDLVRPGSEDLFRMGVRESVLHAVLTALGRQDDYERIVRIEEPDELRAAVLGEGVEPEERALVERLLDTLPVW